MGRTLVAAGPLAAQRRFGALDGMRGCCAVMVAAYHLNPPGHSLLGPLLAHSYLWVDFFFVLSGFVIAHGYADHIADGRQAGIFMVKRLARIYPLHIAVLAVYVCLELTRSFTAGAHAAMADHPPFTSWTSLPSLFANIGLVQGLGLFDVLTWNGPSWSISCEFWTYGLFALVLLSFAGRSVWAWAALATAALMTLGLSQKPTMNIVDGLAIVRCAAGFFAGVLVQRAYRAFFATSLSTTWAGPGYSVLEWTAALATLAFVAFLGDGRVSLLAPVVFAGLVFILAMERGSLSRVLNTSLPAWLGRLSYPIYMVHALFVLLILMAAKRVEAWTGISLTVPLVENGVTNLVLSVRSPLAMDLMTVGFLVLTVGAAAALHLCIEEPARRLITALVQPANRQRRSARGDATQSITATLAGERAPTSRSAEAP